MNTMAELLIKHFGPITGGYSENNGFMKISPVTVFIGNQASGKSTVAKVYSTSVWLEKAFIRGDYDINDFDAEDFRNLIANHGIEEYWTTYSEISYKGMAYSFSYNPNGKFYVQTNKNTTKFYKKPKIMYVPAERNLLTVLSTAAKVKNLPTMLSVLLDEYDLALDDLKDRDFLLPVSDLKLRYDKMLHKVWIVSKNEKSVLINHASSGIQSVAPLSLISEFLSNGITNDIPSKTKILSKEDRNLIKNFIDKNYNKDSELSISLKSELDKFYLTGSEKVVSSEYQKLLFSALQYYFNTCFINIVEEPELSLFPESQANVLYELLSFFNKSEGNQLLITTHSPYLISYLTLAAKAKDLLKSNVPLNRINAVIPSEAAVDGESISIYETKYDGTIRKLESYEGLPSDANILNSLMASSNDKFADLLDLESEFCR